MRDAYAHGMTMLGGLCGMRPVFTQLFHNMLLHGTMWNRRLDQGINSIDLNVYYITTPTQ